jgi:CTD kinase subunit beta
MEGEKEESVVLPNPGTVVVVQLYHHQQQIEGMQRALGCDPNNEVNYRVQGVELIQNVRVALQM